MNKHKVLVRLRGKEDDYLLYVLEKQGFSHEVFMGKPSQIIDRISVDDVDCIVIFASKSDIYGQSIIEQLKFEQVEVPYIVICKENEMDFLKWVVSQNVFYYITEPINEHELITIIKSAIKKKRREKINDTK